MCVCVTLPPLFPVWFPVLTDFPCPYVCPALRAEGNANRSTGNSHLNDQSSRSHAIFRMVIETALRVDDGGDDGTTQPVSHHTPATVRGYPSPFADTRHRSRIPHIPTLYTRTRFHSRRRGRQHDAASTG